MSNVDTYMASVAGVPYTKVYQDLHGHTAAIRVAFETSVETRDFVSKVIREAGFITTDSVSIEEARAYNLRAASLLTFCRMTPGWLPTHNGGAVYADNEKTLLMLPSQNKDGIWGFEIRQLEDARDNEISGSRVNIDSKAGYEVVAAGVDIADVLNSYELKKENEQVFRA